MSSHRVNRTWDGVWSAQLGGSRRGRSAAAGRIRSRPTFRWPLNGCMTLALSLWLTTHASAQSTAFSRGDANTDGEYDLSDPVATLVGLFEGLAILSCDDAADANDDGFVDISDATFSLNFLFLGGVAPPAPGTTCGIDLTADDLGCERYDHCERLPPSGQSEFETPVQGSLSVARDFLGGPEVLAEPAAPVDDGNTPAADATAERSIEEADLYRIVDGRLFVLNRYRGLQIIDLEDLDAPAIIGSAPIFGYPQEMYVRDNTAYILVSDFYNFWLESDALIARGRYGSQVRVVDIADPTDPRVVGNIELAGNLSDSRMVGEVLYLVSQEFSWHYYDAFSAVPRDVTQILSLRVGDPEDVETVDREEFPRSGYDHHIQVTQNAIYLASSGWEREISQYRTALRYIDISDPEGEIDVRGEAKTPGLVQDRWSIDEFDGVLRVASGQTWGNGDIHLSTFSVEDPDHILPLGKTTLKIDERLTAARFQGNRGYLVSFRGIDPLFVFDLSDPTRPTLLGELEMSGWLDFMIPMGDRILALGRDTFVDDNNRNGLSLAVSLIDVASASKPSLLSRVILDGRWGFVPADRDDFAKVFRAVPEQGLVLFPFQAWSEDYRLRTGVQLIDFDDQTLTERGVIEDAGYVERGIPYEENTVLTISDQVYQAVDVSDRDAPERRGALELARNVQEFSILNDEYALQFSGDWNLGDTKLSVTSLEDPNSTNPASQFPIAAPQGRMFTNGSLAYVAGGYDVFEKGDVLDEEGGVAGRETRVQVIDFSNPLAPRERGSVAIEGSVTLGYRDWYWGFGDEVIQVNGSTLAIHRFQYGACLACDVLVRGFPIAPRQEIILVDLADPDNPRVGKTIKIEGAEWAWGLRASGTTLYLSSYTTLARKDAWVARYLLHRVDVSDPLNPVEHPPINIPGMFVDADPSGTVIYTQETRWEAEDRRNRTYVYALEIFEDEESSKAFLRSRVELEGFVNSVQIQDGVAVATTSESGLVVIGAQDVWRQTNRLVTIDLSDPDALRVAGSAEIPFSYGYLQNVDEGRAFVGSGAGVFVYDVADIDNPRFEQFFRTQGWVQDVVVHGDRAFLPTGWYGVQVLDLATQD
jgi:uncharacterized secreted protein with C-terminal beta-propeller domain